MATLIYDETRNFPRISWGAIFAGATLAITVQVLFGVLGSAVASSIINPMRDANPLEGFPYAAGAWLIISTVVSLAIGGYYAGRSAQALGWLHGTLVWSLVALFTAYLLTSAVGSIVGTSATILGKGISVAGQGLVKAAPAVADTVKAELQQNGVNVDYDSLKADLDTLLLQTGKPELRPDRLEQKNRQAIDDAKATVQQGAEYPQAASPLLRDWFERVKQSARPALDAADKEALVNIIVARTGKSREDAEQIADNYERAYNQAMANYQAAKQQAEEKARIAANAAAKNLARASWWTFAMLIVGAIVATAAGNLGIRQQDPIETNATIRDDTISPRPLVR